MEWFEKLDFDEDPFDTDPKEYHDTLVNMDEVIDEMFYRINSGSMLVIEGEKGNGKTSLLMVAAKKFGGNKKVAYVDCHVLENNLNVKKVLQHRYGILGRLLNKKPKNMVVLLDNVEQLSKINTERLKYYFDQNFIKSVIFATNDYKKAKFSESLKDRIGQRVVKIPKFTDNDAVDLIKQRIENSELFNDELIKKIYKMSGNPKKLLENCKKASKEAARKDRFRVQQVDLKIFK